MYVYIISDIHMAVRGLTWLHIQCATPAPHRTMYYLECCINNNWIQ